ncbi:MAG: putative signal transduction protein [Acidimicrobiales bacterium]|nr:putative signal transduction protein [Acidimicrobiales bacterium]
MDVTYPPQRTLSETLAERLQAVPASRPAAVQVLQVAGDKRASATDLAEVLATDPALAATVLKLANSAYYGLAGRIRNLPLAVTVVGFVSIHSIAAAHAAGALGSGAAVPDGFWDRAAASAASCSALAPGLGVPRPEGLCLGLLHELGDYLLLQADPDAHAEIDATTAHWDCRRRAQVEHEILGAHHGELLAHSLHAWNFPADFVDAVRQHPDTSRMADVLPRTLLAGHALSALTIRQDHELDGVDELVEQLTDPLDVGTVRTDQAWTLSRIARHDALQLAMAFSDVA